MSFSIATPVDPLNPINEDLSMPDIDIDEVRIHYDDLGSGPPTVLLHGAAGSGLWFRNLVEPLARHRRLLIPDLRGLGRSQRVPPLPSASVWVDDIVALMDRLDVAACDVVGFSLGSRVAGRLALTHPERVRSMVVDAPIIGLSASASTAATARFSTPDPSDERVAEWKLMHGDDWQDVVEFYAATRSVEGFQDYLTLRSELGQLTTPTLVCRGDLDDAIHPLADAVTWHHEAPRTQLFIAPGLGQSSTIRGCQDDFLRVAGRFWDGLDQRPGSSQPGIRDGGTSS